MESPVLSDTPPSIPEFLSGGGEMGQLIREFDWSATPLGPIPSWPQSLRTCIRIMLTSRQPIWIGWGKDLIKLYNDPYKDIVGGKHPWALGKPASVVWKEIWPFMQPLLKGVMENDEGSYSESQLLIMERNGYAEETYYTFSYTPIPGDDGGTEGMICANTDDTKRIISERQLKTLTSLGKLLNGSQSEKAIINNTIDTLLENPHDFPFVLFYTVRNNKAFLFPHPSVGEHAMPAVPREIDLEEMSELAMLLNKAAISKELQNFGAVHKMLGLLPSGAWEKPAEQGVVLPVGQAATKEPYGFLLTGLNPYRLPDDAYKSFIALIADQVATSFADVHRLEEERKRAEALAEIDRAKTTFFSNISHEFRTPLTLLLGPIEDTLQQTSHEETRTRMEVAYRNVLRMQKLVNTLLDFSRIEAGRVDGRFSRVDIATLTADLVSSFRAAVEKAGMELHFGNTSISADVYVDPDMWEKIVLNLVSNAFKYTREGSIRVSLQVIDKQLQLVVQDTGIGIPEDQLDKIFERFHRVENMDGRSLEGTGIGLAMVKELVKLHHGSIQVTSNIGKGSIFTVSVPTGRDHLPDEKIIETAAYRTSGHQVAAFVEEALKWETGGTTIDHAADRLADTDTHPVWAYTANGITANPTEKKHRVLLADDNADMRQYVNRLLLTKYEVVMANDGMDAWQKIQQHQPDLILSDIMMPRLDGFGLLDKVRNHPDTRNIPVIFLSAMAGEEARVEGLEAGANDYLVKPFSAKELLAAVHTNIRISKTRIAAENNMKNVFRQSPVAMCIFRGDNLVLEMANERALQLWGKKYEDVINRPVLEAFYEIRDQGFDKILYGVYESGKAFVAYEMPVMLIRHGKPETIYVNFIYEPLRNELGQTDGIVGVATDVTVQVVTRRKAEESEREYAAMLEAEVRNRTSELNELNQSLQQSNNDLQQFAHVASHDLKEPLRKIKTFAGRLEDDAQTAFSEKAKIYLNKVNSAANRMFTMIDGVLNYSVINGAEHTIQQVNLNEVIRDIQNDLEIPMQMKKAAVQYHGLPVVEGAAVLLYQLFYNLVNNSLKFARQDVPPVISLSSKLLHIKGKEWVEISLTDNGIGFEQAYAEKIFDTFARLNSKDQYEGTGLGLALCKKIVQRHGGSISAMGKRNGGTIFTIQLPVRQERDII